MVFCARCGVSFTESEKNCPLCGAVPVQNKPEAADSGILDFPQSKPFLQSLLEEQEINPHEKNYIFFELVSIIFGSALFITLLIDVLTNAAITWSRYTSVSIVWAFLLFGMPALIKKHPWILFAILAPSLMLLLFLLDVMNGHISWFLFWGLPLSGWLIACIAGCTGIILGIKKRGLNVVAVVMLFCALFCLGLDILINFNLRKLVFLVWSPIVALSALPAAGMLFYLHFRIVRQASLKKLFRL